MIIKVLALVDIHTLLVLLFSDYMSTTYILAGATFPIIKGIIFFLPSSDLFSLVDIIIGIIMFFLLIGPLWGFLWWIIFAYLIYKIILSFSIM